uniref:Putative rRNA methyltransferase n=1 Tax=Cacopsylla melanoneura TaxID=428564 RepID=A0A8D8UM39_9HEMI
MGKKVKTGKQRKDKYYHLAKETGYRSRAAFKLIQLNRKFEFLQKSKVCVDLCAAPGGWMQVAKQNMMASSIVIGVDLYPIKSIPGTIGLVEDITTDKCRLAISRELKSWKVDVVLHDGAPNVGANWVYDAYQQCCLTLQALKLASGILKEGGWFVTKIFRSRDYTSLLWIFKQLFRQVHSTKPQASRKESAEIFVVCQHYIAPAKLDPKFFEAKYAFKEIDAEDGKMNILRKKQVDKAKALGYPSDVNVLYKELPVTKFVEHETPTVLLQHATEIFFDDDAILNHPSTTAEIQACCKDIRVLGRKDIRNLLKWWKTLHEEKVAADKKAAKEEEGEDGEEKTAKEDEEESMDEEEKDLMRVSKEIDVLKDEERRELKRKKKKVSKERTKLADKMNLKMLLKGDLGPTENDDEEIFRLSQIRTMDQLDLVTGSKPEIVAESDDEVMEVKSKKIRYDVEKSQLDDSGLYYNNPEDSDDLEFESEDEDADDIEKTVEKKLVEAEFDSDEEDGLGLEVSDDEAGSDTDGPPRQKKQKKDKANKKDAKNKKKMTAEELAKWGTVDEHPLITKLDNRTQLDRRVAKANMWFDKDVFKNVEKEDDEDFELDKIATILKEKGKSVRDQRRSKWDEEEAKDERERRKALGKEVGPKKSVSFLNSERGEVEMERKKKVVKAEEEEDGYGTDSDTYTTDSDDDDRNLDDDFGSDYDINDVFNDDDDERPKKDQTYKKVKKTPKEKPVKLSEEELALGSLMVNSKRTKRDLVDAAWNRYTFNDRDAGLPSWFERDEQENMRQEDPVPEALVNEYRAKKVEINVRPIRKVVEAKARKKKRQQRRFDKMKKKLETLMEAPDVSDAEKARNIRALMKKAKAPKKEVKYVVAKKHNTAKKLRIKGIKGPYKVVDKRMKKDSRGKGAPKTGKGGGKKKR